MQELTFQDVSTTNRARCERWHPGFPADGWTGSDWSNAMAGEAGETCNVVKKLRRAEFGKVQAAADNPADLLAKLAMEIGDTFLYLDLLAQFYGLDLARCVVDTFNRVSVREGFPERLLADPPERQTADVAR
jgi:NTP pyrophosphatase (non-canonical NTP hydrolase)